MTVWPHHDEEQRPPDDDLSPLRRKLEARLDVCWDRLDDVVSELCALHGVSEALVVERVRATVAAECSRTVGAERARSR